jgi:hypothetical protein
LNHNYLIDNLSVGFSPPAGVPGGTTNVREANDAAMGFTDITGCDNGSNYHGCKLTSGSPGHNAASDGTDVGVNFAALDAALNGGGAGAVGGPITIGGPVTWH